MLKFFIPTNSGKSGDSLIEEGQSHEQTRAPQLVQKLFRPKQTKTQLEKGRCQQK